MRRVLAVVLVCSMVLVGCDGGGDDDPGVASLDEGSGDAGGGQSDTGVDAEGALLEFSRCVREEGIEDFPDLTPGGSYFTDIADAGVDLGSDELRAATEECFSHLEGVINLDDLDPEVLAELQDNILAIARCVRDEGFDVPEPDFSQGIGPQMFGDIDIDLSGPEFAAALRRCFLEVGFGFGGGSGD